MFDCHLHTEFSTDSSMKIEDAINKAQELNMGIIITEHMDLNFPKPHEFVFDTKAYFKQFEKYRNSKTLLGIELGMTEEYLEKNRELVATHPFDYVLGSLHFVDSIDIYDKILYEGKNKKDVFGRYFINMLQCIKKYDFIDSLAHIDYIARYATYEDKEIYYSAFEDQIDAILKELVVKEKALEINSRRLSDKKTISNMLEIYKRFKELGGKYVTLGSDSHHISGIGQHFTEALEIVDLCDFKMVYFKERKMQYSIR